MGVGEIATDAMQIRCDAIKCKKEAWAKNPGTMPTYLFRTCCPTQVAVALGIEADSGGVEGEEEEGKGAPQRIKQ